ncbi:MAG: ApaG domain [Verrucomicrobiales bacterium]
MIGDAVPHRSADAGTCDLTWICGCLVSGVTDPIIELPEIRVSVESVLYMPSLDAPEDRPHPFLYFICIHNESAETVTIRARKWIVRPASGAAGAVHVVEGDGVVGQTPTLKPGEDFSYNSYHVVPGDSVAEGAFFGEDGLGRRFCARIPAFQMEVPPWV